MKRSLAFLFASIISACLGAQESFDENSRNFDIKLDVAGFNGTVKDNKTDSVRSTSAAAVVLSPQMEWAMNKALSIGGSVSYTHYLDSSASTSSNPLLQGLDANFLFDIHFLRRPKTDMMIGLKLGVAGIRFNANDGTGDVYGSLGSATDIHLMARFYVSNRMAIIGNISVPGYTFKKFGKNLFETSTIKFSGVYIGSGIAFKLPNQKTSGSQRNR